MERLKAHWRRHPARCLVAGCYAAFLLAGLLCGLGRFVYNRALYANGTLAPATLTMEDFALVEMEPYEGGWLTTGSDPQMILRDAARRVDTLRTRFDALNPPLVETAFWAADGQPYSLRRMAYARPDGESRVYTLPAGGGQNLRLDPDSASGNILWPAELVINEKRPFYAFFIPSPVAVALLLAGPALLAGGLAILRQGLAGRSPARKGGGKA